MGVTGPKRQAGLREPNGRLQRPNGRPSTMAVLNAMERQKHEDVMAVAKGQPHRQLPKGVTLNEHAQKMLECPLGRFLVANMQDERRRSIYYDAGLAYGALVARWKAAWGAQVHVPGGDSLGTGEGPSAETVANWRSQIDAIRKRIRKEGGLAVLMWTDLLIIDELPVPTANGQQLMNGLWIISTELGKLDGRLNKVA